MSRRIRRTPYTDCVEEAGVRGFTVVNHMLLPKAYEASVEDDYWHLRKQVQVWDVSCQRQVQIQGPDAERLVQWMTPRRIAGASVGDCLYIPIVDRNGGMINDPVLLKLADNKFWLSIADSDVLLFALGLALGADFDVEIEEPDVSPLAIQGPKSEALMVEIFGSGISELGFFKFDWFEFEGTDQLIARSGYSRQGGFEIYLNDSQLGSKLWKAIVAAGKPYGIRPGCPNLIERIEGGLFSYGNDMTRENNPLELGLAKYCVLDGSLDYLAKNALKQLAEKGPDRKIMGVKFGGDAVPVCASPWPVTVGNKRVGQVTSGIWSPRFEKNVGVSIIDAGHWDAGQSIQVLTPDGIKRDGVVSDFPMK